MFNNLQTRWPSLDKTTFNILPPLKGKFKTLKKQALAFLLAVDKSKLIRDDYKEFVELCLILLGQYSETSMSFKAPGSMSKARWMARAIYAMKLYLFSDQLNLDRKTIEALEKLCVFIVCIYAKSWLTCRFASEAAVLDIDFLKNIRAFRSIDKPVQEAVQEKFSRHTWYLSAEMIGLSLFSDNVPVAEKRTIVKKIKQIPANWSERNIKASFSKVCYRDSCLVNRIIQRNFIAKFP